MREKSTTSLCTVVLGTRKVRCFSALAFAHHAPEPAPDPNYWKGIAASTKPGREVIDSTTQHKYINRGPRRWVATAWAGSLQRTRTWRACCGKVKEKEVETGCVSLHAQYESWFAGRSHHSKG
jgi:hypothetical protein